MAWIAITSRDSQHNVQTYVESFGAKVAASEATAAQLTVPVDRTLRDGDELTGARIIELHGLKTPGEVALHFSDLHTVVVGETLSGAREAPKAK